MKSLTRVATSAAAPSDTSRHLYLDLAPIDDDARTLHDSRKELSKLTNRSKIMIAQSLTSLTASDASLASSMVTKAYPLDRPPPPGSSG